MSRSEEKLLNLYKALPKQDQKSVLDFCSFLVAQNPDAQNPDLRLENSTPKEIPRPEAESVVLAMRRLSDTYFMLNKDDLLHEASGLMSQHILHGKDAVEVIDELEVLFLKFYTALNENQNKDGQ